jgi:hypothetical protein
MKICVETEFSVSINQWIHIIFITTSGSAVGLNQTGQKLLTFVALFAYFIRKTELRYHHVLASVSPPLIFEPVGGFS